MKASYYIGKISLGQYDLIDGNVRQTAMNVGIIFYTNVIVVDCINQIRIAA